MASDELAVAAREIQRLYPQIYLACHVQHTRRRSTEHDLSAQDTTYLGHLDRCRPISPRDLARHLGIAGSTLSAFVKRMQELGFVERRVSARDRRAAELCLTERGEAVMQETSVLDFDRLRLVLGRLTAAERARALAGLGVLATACVDARVEYRASAPHHQRRDMPCNEPNPPRGDA